MDNVYVVVVKEAGLDVSPQAVPTLGPLRIPTMFAPATREARRKYRVAVWRAVKTNSGRCLNRHVVLGMMAVLGISVASWAGVAALILRIVR